MYSTMALTVLILTSVTYAACTVSATPLSFGSYDVFSAAPLDSTGTITVSCDERRAPQVLISIGQSTNSGGFDPRAMKHATGGELLMYNLYTNNGRSRIWGDGSGNTSTVTRKVRRNRPLNRTVHGRVPPLQDVEAGAYHETLTVTILW